MVSLYALEYFWVLRIITSSFWTTSNAHPLLIIQSEKLDMGKEGISFSENEESDHKLTQLSLGASDKNAQGKTCKFLNNLNGLKMSRWFILCWSHL